MKLNTLAEKLDVAPATLKRWTRQFKAYTNTPSEPPKRGKVRHLDDHSARVLFYVSTERAAGIAFDQIEQGLREIQEKDWQGLPDLPAEWYSEQENPSYSTEVQMTLYQHKAVIQRLEDDKRKLQDQLHEANERVEKLQTELDNLKQDRSVSREKVHELELELERANTERSELAAQLKEEAQAKLDELKSELNQAVLEKGQLEARLSNYSFGGAKPVPISLIIVTTAVTVVLLVLAVFVVARLVL